MGISQKKEAVRHVCMYCSSSFASKQSLQRHTHDMTCIKKLTCSLLPVDTSRPMNDICKDLMDQVEERFTGILSMFQKQDKAIEDLRCEVTRLRSELYEIKKTSTTNTKINNVQGNHNTTTNSSSITNHVTIVLRNYGKEDVSHITQNDLTEWAKDPETGVLMYVKKKHFDPEKPENRNIRLNSIKRQEVGVYKDGQWHPEDAQKFTSKVIENTLESLQGGMDWNTLTPKAEYYYDKVSENANCSHGKTTQKEIINLLQCERKSM